jgi:hypothetical protein
VADRLGLAVAAYAANKANVLNKLFEAVQTVEPKPHQNSRARA